MSDPRSPAAKPGLVRGKLIALEGIDGSGTTTQTARIGERMRQASIPATTTAEPSSGPIGSLLRQLLRREQPALAPLVMAQLFAADRVDHMTKTIEPALQAHSHVLTDRYVMSSIVYQSLTLPRQTVVDLNFAAIAADLTLFFSIAPETALLRRSQRGGAQEMFDDFQTQRRLSDEYRQEAIAMRQAGQQVIEIDASLAADTVTDQAWIAIKNCLLDKTSAG